MKLPDNQNKQEKQLILSSVSAYSGILPHPDLLEKFDKIIPSGADRIMKMAEKQSAHRIALETVFVVWDILASFIGQVCGLIIGLAGIYFGYKTIISGHPVVGTILSGGTLTGLVSVFVLGKSWQAKNLDENNARQS
jgi:uncharacterized membrane protein